LGIDQHDADAGAVGQILDGVLHGVNGPPG
jgi:hypothetical protein